MILATIIVFAFSGLLFAAAVAAVFHAGEKDGICKYGYLDDDEKEGD